jgi:hypothetical protein
MNVGREMKKIANIKSSQFLIFAVYCYGNQIKQDGICWLARHIGK